MKKWIVKKFQALKLWIKLNKAKAAIISALAVAITGIIIFIILSSGKQKEVVLFEVNKIKITKGTYTMILVNEALSLRQGYFANEKPLDEMTAEEIEEYLNKRENFWDIEIDGRKPFDIVKENAMKQIKAYAFLKRGAQRANVTMTDDQRMAFETLMEAQLIGQEVVEIDKDNPDKIYLELFGVTRDEYMDYMVDMSIHDEYFMLESSKLNVTEGEIKDYFDKNRYYYASNTIYNIFLSYTDEKGNSLSDAEKSAKKQLAQNIKKMIQEGNDIESLVALYSEADGTELSKGKYIINKKSIVEKTFGTDFILWSVNANPGDIDIIETDKGINIAKCIEVDGITANLEPIKSEVRQIKYNEVIEKAIQGSDYDAIIVDEEVLKTIDKVPGSIAN